MGSRAGNRKILVGGLSSLIVTNSTTQDLGVTAGEVVPVCIEVDQKASVHVDVVGQVKVALFKESVEAEHGGRGPVAVVDDGIGKTLGEGSSLG